MVPSYYWFMKNEATSGTLTNGRRYEDRVEGEIWRMVIVPLGLAGSCSWCGGPSIRANEAGDGPADYCSDPCEASGRQIELASGEDIENLG